MTITKFPDFNEEFYLQVKEGLVPGHSVLHKYGRNPDIDTASGFEAIWNGGGDYTGHDATVAETLEVFSSSANDAGTLVSSGTATGGTSTTLVDSGATFVSDGVVAGDMAINDTQQDHAFVTSLTETELTFLRMNEGAVTVSTDAYRVVTTASTGTSVVKLLNLKGDDFIDTSEYIIMNGVTAVDTVGTYIRQDRARCYGLTNIGDITSRQNVTVANVMMVLPIGYNSTMIAAYTVPAGKRAFVLTWNASAAKKTSFFSNVRLLFREVNGIFQVMEEFTVATTGSSYVTRNYVAPKDSIPEKSDIKIMADSSVNDVGIAAGFDLIMVDDGV